MTEEVVRHMARLRRVCSPSTWSPELSDLGRAQNAGPAESVPLWSTEILNPSGLHLGMHATQGCFRQLPCRAA